MVEKINPQNHLLLLGAGTVHTWLIMNTTKTEVINSTSTIQNQFVITKHTSPRKILTIDCLFISGISMILVYLLLGCATVFAATLFVMLPSVHENSCFRLGALLL